MGLKANDIIGARYRVRFPVGRRGAVAASLRHGSDVLITLQDGWTASELGRQAFARDARRLMALRHEHLVTHLDHGWCEAFGPYLVTERTGRPLPGKPAMFALPNLGHVMAQLCAALQAVHAAGVVHHALAWSAVVHDPTPEDPWRVRLGDFCPVPPVEPGEPGVLAGDPATMAPEMVAGQAVDGRADQYGLGILLWEALDGRPPYEDPDFYGLLRKHVAGVLPQLSAVGRSRLGSVPGLEPVLRRALATAPEARFATMADLHAALCGAWNVTPRPEGVWHGSPPEQRQAEAQVHRARPVVGRAVDATIRASVDARGRVPAAMLGPPVSAESAPRALSRPEGRRAPHPLRPAGPSSGSAPGSSGRPAAPAPAPGATWSELAPSGLAAPVPSVPSGLAPRVPAAPAQPVRGARAPGPVIAPTLDLRGADLGPGLEAPSVAPAGPVGPGGLQSFGAATVLEAVPEHRQTPPLRVEVPASARPKGWGATPRWTRWAFVIGIACWLAAGAVTLARGLST